MYSLIRPLLFRLDPERAHDIIMNILAALSSSRITMRAMHMRRPPALRATSFMNLAAASQFGLAAGLDKNARAFPALRALGFGWVEVGTVTPRPQPGNDKPRLFRLADERALINRMGFNSCGVERFVQNLSSRRAQYDSILGINIGKNARTPIEHAEEDYLRVFQKVYPYADYIAVNVSSPNTPSLRDLQHVERLKALLGALLYKRRQLHSMHERWVPIAVKLSPDLSESALRDICELLGEVGIDGLIATNTTTSRPARLTSGHRHETGGLSGPPLEPLSNKTTEILYKYLGGETPIIGAGGVEDAASAARKLAAGACAVQSYTAFVYHGPELIKRLLPGSDDVPPTAV